MSLLAGHDVTMGMADTVARFLYMTPLAIESQGDVLLDAPLLVRSVTNSESPPRPRLYVLIQSSHPVRIIH